MLLVTGGINSDNQWQDKTDVFDYTIPHAGSWRAGGRLPSPRYGLRAAMVGDLLHVSGGYDPDSGDMDEILAWDSVSETWSVAGHMKTGRENHSVTEVSLAVVADYCSAN